MMLFNRSKQYGALPTLVLLVFGCHGRLDVGDTTGGSGGASGSSSAGMGGSAPKASGGSVATLSIGGNASVLGTSTSCPAEAPAHLASCQMEQMVCGYRSGVSGQELSYQECGCYDAGKGELKWSCYESESDTVLCPLTQPSAGESCLGSSGLRCHYPVRVTCDCDSDVGWSCAQLGDYDRLTPPSTLDLGKAIDELSNADREALCRWLVDARLGPGLPEEPAVVGGDGFTVNAGCDGCWDFPTDARAPWLSYAQCLGNLNLSACAAPVSELVDCVASIYSACRVVGNGCTRYLEKPGCAGTAVVNQAMTSKGGDSCSIQVE